MKGSRIAKEIDEEFRKKQIFQKKINNKACDGKKSKDNNKGSD